MLKKVIIVIAIMLSSFVGTMAVAPAAYAKAPALPASTKCKEKGFFSLPTWYKYLDKDVEKSKQTGQCEVSFNLMENGVFNGSDILLVGLAIIDIMVRVAGLVALGFIIYGGFQYMTSQGSPDGTKGALNTILNSAIGLLVAILAAAIVSFIGNSIG
jgi:Type IV secretion system pilin